MSSGADLAHGGGAPDAVVAALQQRFRADQPYSRLGAATLVSVNPLRTLANLNDASAETYRTHTYAEANWEPQGRDPAEVLPPHPYELAARVYHAMRRTRRSQALVFTGATEAGKSFVSKLIRDQLMRLSIHSRAEKRLADNLKNADIILSAFGHAKTKANADASRFSRYTELHYDPSGATTGARVFTFGLDKSRVIRLPREERTFHVFYQLVAGASHEEREALRIEDILSYQLFNSSRCYRLPGGPYSDDSLMMDSLRSAMLQIGFKPKHVTSIFSILAAILALGNLQFGDHNGFDASFEAAHLLNPAVLTDVADLLAVDEEALTQALTHRTRCVKKEVVTSLLNASSSAKQRDTLVRDTYATLFAFIVETINHKLAPPETGSTVISSLDLPGFTSKEGHSLEGYFSLGFEDFNNNLMAETFFNWLTTREFDDNVSLSRDIVADGIDLPQVSVPDNAPIVELLRGTVVGMAADYRPSGLLGVMDRAGAKIRSGKLNEDDDPSLAADMDTFAYHTAYVSTQAMYASSGQRNQFGVRHYQGPCVYSVENFLAADADAFDAGFVTLLRGSRNTFIARLFSGPSLAIETHPLDDNVIVGAQVTSRPLRETTPLGDRLASEGEDKPYLDQDKMYGVSRQLNATLTEMIHNLETADTLWSVMCLRANEISQPSAFDAALVKAQVASLHLPGLIARKRVEFFKGTELEEFCRRYSDFVIPIAAAAGAEDERGQVQALGIANAWRDGQDYALGENKVWLSYSTWRKLEDRLRASQGEQDPVLAMESGDVNDMEEEEEEGGYPPTSRAMPAAPMNPFEGGATDGQSYRSRSIRSQPNNAWAGAGLAGTEWEQEAYGGVNPGMMGAPEKEDLKVKALDAVEEDGEVTRVRRVWKAIVWGLTFWIPNFLISSIGRIHRPDVMFAWREKVAIFALILCANGLVLFYIIGVGQIVCPEYNKVWDTSQLSEHGASNNFWVAVAGKVYDITKFYRGSHSNDPSYFSMTDDQKTGYFGGKDISLYFPVPLYVGCPGLVNDKTLELTYSVNSTMIIEQVPGQVIHYSGAAQDDKGTQLAADDWYPNQFVPTMQKYYKGDFVYTKEEFKSQGTWRNWVSVNNKVYDLTDYINSQSMASNASQWAWLNTDLVNLFRNQAGTDVTKDFDSVLNSIPKLEQTQNKNCLDKVFYVGKRDPRETPRCMVQNYILLSFSAIIMLIMVSKFAAALQLTPKRNPEQQDKFVVCQIPCYTEDEESLRKTIDSIAALKYDDKRKLIFLICDGMIVGSGNDAPTPRIVLDILGVDPRIDPEPLAFKSVAEGSKQLNFAKIYSGLYEFEGHVVPYIVVVKVGRPSERARPGNRGKRDTQILLMRWLNRVHFDAPMSPLELELTHQCKNVIGIDPAFYEYVLTVDADTRVREDSLNRLVAVTADDNKIIALCGETMLDNEQSSWWTMIQVYEYYISHHLAKAFESLFGSVTCLPGCFSIYRIRSADKGKPLFISSRVIEEYSENKVDTLHKKNLFALGEDRYLTTLLLKNFPMYKTKFTSDAKSLTSAPDRWGILLSQRRRWINSTVHNLAELSMMEEMCGFCLFSMRFVVFIDLVGTIILPSTVVYLVYMIYMAATKRSAVPYISIALIAATYGLQAIIFLLKRQWQYIGWMFIYLLAYPVWSFFLPVYSFWHMDDFSWGNTRVVVGEKGNKKIVAGTDDEPYHDSMIPLKRFSEYQHEVWERGSLTDNEGESLTGAEGPFGNPLITGSMPNLPHGSMYKGSVYKGSHLGDGSVYKGGSVYSDEESDYDTGDYYQRTNVIQSAGQSRSNLSRPARSQVSHSAASHAGAPPAMGQQTPFASMYGMPAMQGSMYGLPGMPAGMPSMYGMPPGSMYGMPAPSMLGGMGGSMLGVGGNNSMMDVNAGMGGMQTPLPQDMSQAAPQPAPQARPMSTNPFAAPAVSLPPRDTASPTDAEIVLAVQTYLAQQPSLMNVTKRSAREAVMAAFPNAPTIKEKKALINKAIDDTLRGE